MDDTVVRTLADRQELRDLVATYAHGADRREPHTVAGCFTSDGRLVVHMKPRSADNPSVRTGHDEIAAAIAGLDRYIATTHLVANQLIALDGDTATGETYCIAHHIHERDGVERDKVMSIRYLDTYARTDEGWRIAERTLHCDWVEDRALSDR